MIPRRPACRLLLILAVALATTACARPALRDPVGPASAVRDFSFATDTFWFRNEIRARHPDVPDLYAHHCFVLAKLYDTEPGPIRAFRMSYSWLL